MAFAKIPKDIVKALPDVHSLSKSFALKIVALINKSKANQRKLIELASEIGAGISSPARLDNLVENDLLPKLSKMPLKTSRQYKSKEGETLFTFKYDQRGTPSIAFHKGIVRNLDFDKLCKAFKKLIEDQRTQSGYPD